MAFGPHTLNTLNVLAASMTQKTQVVRLRKGKRTFEVLCYPGTVKEFRAGKIKLRSVLVTDVIFKNASKGDRAKESDLGAAFSGLKQEERITAIITDGVSQSTSNERKEDMEMKKNEVVSYLHQNFVDPQTGRRLPRLRLELALANSKMRLDATAPAKSQAMHLVKLLQGSLNLKPHETCATIAILTDHVGAASGVIYKHSTVKRQRRSAGEVVFDVGVAPGDWDSFISALNKPTQGNFRFSLADGSATGKAPSAQDGKGRKGKESSRDRRRKQKQKQKNQRQTQRKATGNARQK